MRSRIFLALVALAVVAAPSVVAHGLINLNVVVPADCPGDQAACLATIDAQPTLHAGDEVSFFAYNDDRVNHTLHVAPNASRAPDGAGSTGAALASTGSIPPNGSIDGGEFAIPGDADALYVWCSTPGHEGDGERLVVESAEPAGADRDEAGLPVLMVVSAVIVAASARRGET